MTQTQERLQQAQQRIMDMLARSEKAQLKFTKGTAQHTLLKNRIYALRTACILIKQELNNSNHDLDINLNNVKTPLVSLLNKSEKSLQKLTPNMWQYKMLTDTIQALQLALLLLEKNESKFL